MHGIGLPGLWIFRHSLPTPPARPSRQAAALRKMGLTLAVDGNAALDGAQLLAAVAAAERERAATAADAPLGEWEVLKVRDLDAGKPSSFCHAAACHPMLLWGLDAGARAKSCGVLACGWNLLEQDWRGGAVCVLGVCGLWPASHAHLRPFVPLILLHLAASRCLLAEWKESGG